MLNFTNVAEMSKEMRVSSLKRALYAQPFFAKLPVEVTTGTELINQFANKLEVNRDFFLTEVQTNLGEVFTDTGSLFNLSLYTAYQKSIYRFDANQPLPNSFFTYEARFKTVFNQLIYDDRQQEIAPFLIRNGDKLVAILENTAAKIADTEAIIVAKGFQNLEIPFIDDRTQQSFNASLDKDTRFEYFKFTVDADGLTTHIIENDVFPRLVLGFGCRNSTKNKAEVSESSVRITDQTRRLQLNTEFIPVEFFAPRLTCLRDTHIYYLPIEYYFQPFARLQFDVINTSPEQVEGYEFIMLTRTI